MRHGNGDVVIIASGAHEYEVFRTDRHFRGQFSHVLVKFPLGHGFGKVEIILAPAVFRNRGKQIIQACKDITIGIQQLLHSIESMQFQTMKRLQLYQTARKYIIKLLYQCIQHPNEVKYQFT